MIGLAVAVEGEALDSLVRVVQGSTVDSSETHRSRPGRGKADFGHMYDRPDPREYFRTLAEFDYEISYLTERTLGRLVGSRPLGGGFRVADVAVRADRRAPGRLRDGDRATERGYFSAADVRVGGRAGLSAGRCHPARPRPERAGGPGRYYADLYVSRPAADAAQRPLEDLRDVSALSVRP